MRYGCIWKPQVLYENYLRVDDEVRNYMLYQKLVYKIENDSQFEKSARNIFGKNIMFSSHNVVA